jgi:succinylglutamate desuccinylase
LEALRLANLRQEIMGHADTQRELARYYLDLLTQIYRSQRSVFLVPPARELRSVAERLVEVDPENRVHHQLLLAELAWDRGDVAASVELGRNALASLSSGDWYRLRQHPGFARAVERHLEALTVLGANPDAIQVLEKVRAVGLDDPVLSADCRKLETQR